MFVDPNAKQHTLIEILHSDSCHYDDQAGAIIDQIIFADPKSAEMAQGLGKPQTSAEYKQAVEALSLARGNTMAAKFTLLQSARTALLNDARLATLPKPKGYARGFRVRVLEDRMLDFCLLRRPIAYDDLNRDNAVCTNTKTNALNELKLKCAATLKNDPEWKDIFTTNGIVDLETDVLEKTKADFIVALLEKPSFGRALAVRYCDTKDISPIATMEEELIAEQKRKWQELFLPDEVTSFVGMMRPYVKRALERQAHEFNKETSPRIRNAVRDGFTLAWKHALANQEEMAKLLSKPKLTSKNKKDIVIQAYLFCNNIRLFSSIEAINERELCIEKRINTEQIEFVSCAKSAVRGLAPKTDLDQFEFSHYLFKSMCKNDALFNERWLRWRLYSLKSIIPNKTRKDVQRKFIDIVSALQNVERFWKERAEDAVKLSAKGQP